MLCNCNNIEVGSYGNQVEIMPLPPHMAAYKTKQGGTPDSICVDRCLADEVQHLWSQGITTTGCCCGHNQVPAYIGVIDEDIEAMKMMGYEVQHNQMRPGDHDSFKPKN